jgi:putative transposase
MPKPPSQTWKALLENYVNELISIDFFTVTTVSFQILSAFMVLAHHRRRALNHNVM